MKDTITLTYGVVDTRSGAVITPRSVELTSGEGEVIEITNSAHHATDCQFYVLDVDHGDQYAQAYNLVELETRAVDADIMAEAGYIAEAEPAMGPRRYSVGPSFTVSAVQLWWLVVNLGVCNFVGAALLGPADGASSGSSCQTPLAAAIMQHRTA